MRRFGGTKPCWSSEYSLNLLLRFRLVHPFLNLSLLCVLRDLSIVCNGTKQAGALNFLIMQLRKCCLHPFLFPGAEDDPDTTSLEDLIGQSGKLAVLDLLLQSLFKKGHRVTLFSQFSSVLDILDDYCRLRGWKYCRFDGVSGCRCETLLVSSSQID